MEDRSICDRLSDTVFDQQEIHKKDNKNEDCEKSFTKEADGQKIKGVKKILRQNPYI